MTKKEQFMQLADDLNYSAEKKEQLWNHYEKNCYQFGDDGKVHYIDEDFSCGLQFGEYLEFLLMMEQNNDDYADAYYSYKEAKRIQDMGAEDVFCRIDTIVKKL